MQKDLAFCLLDTTRNVSEIPPEKSQQVIYDLDMKIEYQNITNLLGDTTEKCITKFIAKNWGTVHVESGKSNDRLYQANK